MRDLKRVKERRERFASITAYDATMARLAAKADLVLVGDSLGMAVQGHGTTLPVTLDQMVYHSAMVERGLARAVSRAHLMVDMPFGSYQPSVEQAVRSAVRLMAEGGAHSVKLEGGAWLSDTVRALARSGVPTCCHLGLTPQSVHQLGGYRVQGRDPESAERMLADARELSAAGAAALLLECVPAQLSKRIDEAISIPTIGIGAGPHLTSQVLVFHDLLGLDSSFLPSFAKRYLDGEALITGAVDRYIGEVRAGSFPGEAHSL